LVDLEKQNMSISGKGKNERLEKFSHYLAGALIILKGIDKAEHFNKHPVICILLFLIGGFIIFANFRHSYFEKHFKEFKSVLFFCEGVVLAMISYYYFDEGKKYIHFFYALAAVIYIIVSIVFYRKKIKNSIETEDSADLSSKE